jgi:acetyl esterase/lipase
VGATTDEQQSGRAKDPPLGRIFSFPGNLFGISIFSCWRRCGHLWDGDDFKLNPDVPVTKNTPPTFLLQAEDDNVDGAEQSLVYYLALKKAEVPVEMHLYAKGGHGFGLRPTKLPISHWPGLVETWLRTIGMIKE